MRHWFDSNGLAQQKSMPNINQLHQLAPLFQLQFLWHTQCILKHTRTVFKVLSHRLVCNKCIGYVGINIECESIAVTSPIPAWGSRHHLLLSCLHASVAASCVLWVIWHRHRGRVNAHWKDTKRRTERDTDVRRGREVGLKILSYEESRSTDREI